MRGCRKGIDSPDYQLEEFRGTRDIATASLPPGGSTPLKAKMQKRRLSSSCGAFSHPIKGL